LHKHYLFQATLNLPHPQPELFPGLLMKFQQKNSNKNTFQESSLHSSALTVKY